MAARAPVRQDDDQSTAGGTAIVVPLPVPPGVLTANPPMAARSRQKEAATFLTENALAELLRTPSADEPMAGETGPS